MSVRKESSCYLGIIVSSPVTFVCLSYDIIQVGRDFVPNLAIICLVNFLFWCWASLKPGP